jgi:hypothetical protein
VQFHLHIETFAEWPPLTHGLEDDELERPGLDSPAHEGDDVGGEAGLKAGWRAYRFA